MVFKSKIPRMKNLESNFSPNSINLSKTAMNNNGYNTSQNYNIQISYKNDEVTNTNYSKEYSNTIFHNSKDRNKETPGKDLRVEFNEILIKNKQNSSSNKDPNNNKNIKKDEKSFLNSISRQYTTNILKMKDNLGLKRNSKLQLVSESFSNSNNNINQANSFIFNKNKKSLNKNISNLIDRDSSKEGNSQVKLKNFYRLNTDLDNPPKNYCLSKDRQTDNNIKLDSSFRNSIIQEEQETNNPFENVADLRSYQFKPKKASNNKSSVNYATKKKIDINYLNNKTINNKDKPNLMIKKVNPVKNNKYSTDYEKIRSKLNTNSKTNLSIKDKTDPNSNSYLLTNDNISKNISYNISNSLARNDVPDNLDYSDSNFLNAKLSENYRNDKPESKEFHEKTLSIDKINLQKSKVSLTETIDYEIGAKKSAISILENLEEKSFHKVSDGMKYNELNSISKNYSDERPNFTIYNNSDMQNFSKLNYTGKLNNNGFDNEILQVENIYNKYNNSNNEENLDLKLKQFCALAQELSNSSSEHKFFVLDAISNLYKKLNNGNSIFSVETNDTKSNNVNNLNLKNFSTNQKNFNSANNDVYNDLERLNKRNKKLSIKEQVEELLINKDNEEITKDILIENMQREIINLKTQMKNYMDIKLDESYMEDIANRIIKKIKPESVDIDKSLLESSKKNLYELSLNKSFKNEENAFKNTCNDIKIKESNSAFHTNKHLLLVNNKTNNDSSKSKSKSKSNKKYESTISNTDSITVNKNKLTKKKTMTENFESLNISKDSNTEVNKHSLKNEEKQTKDLNEIRKMTISSTEKDNSIMKNSPSINKFYQMGKLNLRNENLNLHDKNVKLALRLHKKSYSDLQKFNLPHQNRNNNYKNKNNFYEKSATIDHPNQENNNKKVFLPFKKTSKLNEFREMLKLNKFKKALNQKKNTNLRNSLFGKSNTTINKAEQENFKHKIKEEDIAEESDDMLLIQSQSMISTSRNLDFDLDNDFCLNENLLFNNHKEKRNVNHVFNLNGLTGNSKSVGPGTQSNLTNLHLDLNNIQTVSFNDEFFQHESSFSPSWRNACN